MPVQVQQNNLAQRLKNKLVAAHEATKNKETRTDQGARLPHDIQNGTAQLTNITYGKYKADAKNGLGGKDYIMFRAILVSPVLHTDGTRIAGIPLQAKIIPLDDTPGLDKKKTFADHWDDVQDLFRQLGVNPPDVDNVPDDGKPMAIQNYYDAAIKSMVNDKTSTLYRPHFKLRTWRGEKQTTGKYAGKEPLTQETWGAKVEFNGVADPGAGITEQHQPGTNGDTSALQPEPFTEPPQGGAAEAPAAEEPASEEPSQEDIIMALVEVANGDPDNTTEDGASAKQQLEEYAIAAGATQEQVTAAANWEEVAAMALGNVPEAAPTGDPKVGDARKFKKRDSKGNPLANVKDKKPFPAIDIEIVSVDPKAKTVTAKDKAGKPVTAIGGKTPLAIKWEWLE